MHQDIDTHSLRHCDHSSRLAALARLVALDLSTLEQGSEACQVLSPARIRGEPLIQMGVRHMQQLIVDRVVASEFLALQRLDLHRLRWEGLVRNYMLRDVAS